MIIDEVVIYVRSGKGGDGCISFRREKYVPKGGPDGGDGGRGGDVIIRGDHSMTTLQPLAPRPHYRAVNGGPGQGRSKHGADGADQIVDVPLGCLVFDQETGESLADITDDGQRIVIARGGRGGFGNEHFKSATNQTPREGTPGEPWVERTLRLELKLIADVGLVGLPNAGKSTMLRALSRATPRVADYPFTTTSPHLGIAELPGAEPRRRVVIADLPGLIEGAAEGAGLGHAFLKHIERTRVLVHVLDVRPADASDAIANYRTVRRELEAYSDELAAKREIVVLNKIDLVPESERQAVVREIEARMRRETSGPVLVTSGATGEGTRELLEACWEALGVREAAPGWAARSGG